MKNTLLVLAVFLCAACGSKQQKDFSTVKIGMTKDQVIKVVGEPGNKNDIGIEFWIYKNADRTIVFRSDTVYDVITSAGARMDSIKSSIESAGKKVETGIKKMADSIDSAAKRVKNDIKKKL